MSDRGSPAPGRVTRAALAPPAKPVDYRQTHVVNAPATFTQAPLKTYTPAVPSRLRPVSNAHSPHGSPAPPYLPQQQTNQPTYLQPQQSTVIPPVSYPPGNYPLAAVPPGSMARGYIGRRPLAQAKLTTYESRMKTGVTTLIQPINITGGPNAAFAQLSSAGAGGSTPVAAEGRRRTTRVNYAEDDAYEGLEDDDAGDGSGTRYSRRMAQQSRRGGETASNGDMQAGWSWLGDRTPSDRVTSSMAHPIILSCVTSGEDELDREAYKPVLLAPIRIELDTETHRIRDYFTWNVNERLISPYEFATVLCRDLHINAQQYADSIATMIVGQCEEYAELLNIDILDDADVDNNPVEEAEDADGLGSAADKLTGNGLRSRGTSAGASTPGLGTPLTGTNTPLPDDLTSRAASPALGAGKRSGTGLDLDRVHKRVRFNRPGDVDVVKDANGEIKEAGAAPKESEAEEADCRVIVNLDVQISTFNLRDRIEWDLSSTMTPEAFTASYCTELGLTGEAKPIIAHAIHEEILKHKKDAYETGLYGPGAIQYESREDAPKRLRGVWRDYWDRDEFGPVMIPLTAEMMQASEEGRSREARRMRREAARGAGR